MCVFVLPYHAPWCYHTMESRRKQLAASKPQALQQCVLSITRYKEGCTNRKLGGLHPYPWPPKILSLRSHNRLEFLMSKAFLYSSHLLHRHMAFANRPNPSMLYAPNPWVPAQICKVLGQKQPILRKTLVESIPNARVGENDFVGQLHMQFRRANERANWCPLTQRYVRETTPKVPQRPRYLRDRPQIAPNQEQAVSCAMWLKTRMERPLDHAQDTTICGFRNLELWKKMPRSLTGAQQVAPICTVEPKLGGYENQSTWSTGAQSDFLQECFQSSLLCAS